MAKASSFRLALAPGRPAAYPKRGMTMQCRESDLAFLNQSDQLCFQLRSIDEPSTRFFVPIPYKEFGRNGDGNTLPSIDIDALKKEFSSAVMITEKQIKAIKLDDKPIES